MYDAIMHERECVADVERLPVLHDIVYFIFLSPFPHLFFLFIYILFIFNVIFQDYWWGQLGRN